MVLVFFTSFGRAATIEAITFAEEPGKIYLPLTEAVSALSLDLERDAKGHCTRLNGFEVPASLLRCFTDGTELINGDQLQSAGCSQTIEPTSGQFILRFKNRQFVMTPGTKRVEVSLARQQLEAWQGARLVLRTRVSSGRHGTPMGDFVAGPDKERMHYSHLFHQSPMPWSVQINGNIFIHGFTSVPDVPASHGCIRLPLTEGNPAKFFYEWVDLGTPVRVLQ